MGHAFGTAGLRMRHILFGEATDIMFEYKIYILHVTLYRREVTYSNPLGNTSILAIKK